MFLPNLCNVMGTIATLVAHDHTPTIDDLEFVGMTDHDGDLISDVVSVDLGSDPSTSTSEEGCPLVSEYAKVGRPSWLYCNCLSA